MRGRVNQSGRRVSRSRKNQQVAIAAKAIIEELEGRQLLSFSPLLSPSQLLVPATWQARPDYAASAITPDGSSSPSGITPAQMQGAYGVSSTVFGNVKGDGTGQTIAIVDAYDYPTALSDLNAFSAYFSLPQFNTGATGSPTFTKYNQTGTTSPLPGTDPAGAGNDDWEIEEALDIEWAHSIAPKANIDLVEANDASGNLYTGDQTAANLPGVAVVSNSWGGTEFAGETSTDSIYNRTGVTYVFSSGDSGAYESNSQTVDPSYPGSSPNVVSVGGTSLTLGAGNTYGGESAWGNGTESGYFGGGGGGISSYETIPAYQVGKNNGLSSTNRTYPDVALDADPNTGVPVYDTYDFGTGGPFETFGGTSLAAPMWSGLLAIANQGRVANGSGVLTGTTQTLPDLYSAPSGDYRDVTTGNNGYAAGPGYDLTTGIGTPIANLLLPALAPSAGTAPVVTTNPLSQSLTVGQDAKFTAAASGSPTINVQWMVETPLSNTFTAIGGATSTTLDLGAATLAESGNKYEAVFTNGIGSPATTTAATLTVTPATATGGSLSGVSSTAGSAYNLTTLGTSDWAHWGTTGNATAFDRKAAGASQISNVTKLGTGANYGGYTDASRDVSWTDGTPLVSDARDSGYIWANNVIGAGYSFTVPASTTTQTLSVYLGGYSSGGTLTAHLSDSSATDYSVSFSGSAIYSDVATITFKAASNGQTLMLSYAKSQTLGNAGGSVDLVAAWLGGTAPTGTAPVVTTNPLSQSLTVGQDAKFTAAASGSPTINVQWMVETPLSNTFTAIGGATSTTLDLGAATLAESGNKYEAVFTNGIGSPATTTAATLTVTPATATGGSLSGVSSAAGSAYNLTTLGTSDWAHWGTSGNATAFDHKAAGASQISNVTKLGTGANYGGYTDASRDVSWTDGTPLASDTADSGYIWANNVIGAGYSFTVPASTTTQTLSVYLGGYSSGGTLTAHLSDSSATDYSVSFSGSAIYSDVATITYKAASAGQTLVLSYAKSQTLGNAGGSVDLVAAWLGGTAPTGTAPVVTTNPLSQSLTVGQDAKFTAAASGSPTINVQWMVETPLSNTFTAIGGATSTTLDLGAATLAESGNKYEAVFTNGIGSPATTTAATLTVTSPVTSGGSLSGVSSTAGSAYNLTTLGTSDWAHWGTSGNATAFDDKATGGSQISKVTELGAGNYNGYLNSGRDVSWTDGSPVTSDSADTGYIWANNAIGAGYSFTVPASTTKHTVYIYLGGYSSGSTLAAHLSDKSAADYSVTVSGSGTYSNVIAITYNAASNGQTLTLSYVKSQTIGSASGSTDLDAAWLV